MERNKDGKSVFMDHKWVKKADTGRQALNHAGCSPRTASSKKQQQRTCKERNCSTAQDLILRAARFNTSGVVPAYSEKSQINLHGEELQRYSEGGEGSETALSRSRNNNGGSDAEGGR